LTSRIVFRILGFLQRIVDIGSGEILIKVQGVSALTVALL
jgi:hypothetical protein